VDHPHANRRPSSVVSNWSGKPKVFALTHFYSTAVTMVTPPACTIRDRRPYRMADARIQVRRRGAPFGAADRFKAQLAESLEYFATVAD
jgi:hypothetical protein